MEASITSPRPAPARRRRNAPIRGARRPATTVPDLLLGMVAAAWAMAAVFLVASFFDSDAVPDDASRALARVFAGALAVTGGLLFAIAMILLRPERSNGDHYRAPLVVGAVVGMVESAFFLKTVDSLLFVPPFFLLLGLRPVRRALSSLLLRKGGSR